MVSAIRLHGTSGERARHIEEAIPVTKGVMDTIYPWWWDEREFPRRAVMTEWFYNPLKGQPRYVDIYRLRALAASEWVFMCTSTIIEEVAQVPWEIVPKDPKLQESPPEDILTDIDEVKYFLNNPNDNKGETINTIFRAFLQDSLTIDAGCLVKGFSADSYARHPAGGYELKPQGERMLSELFARDGGSFLKETDVNGIEYRYWQYSYLHPAVAPIEFDVNEIIYSIRYPRSYSVYGWSEIQSMETILNLLINSAFTNSTMFQEYAVPSGIVSFTGSEEDENRLRAYFASEIKGRFHKVAVLNKDAKFVPLTYTARDLEFLKGQEWFAKLVWAIYKLTPTELGFQDEIRETGKAMAGQAKIQKRKAILPLLRLIEQVMNLQVLSEFSPRIKFQFNFVDKEEEFAETELDIQKINQGLVTINEWRKKRKVGGPVAWGDEPLQLTLRKLQAPAAFGIGSNPREQIPTGPEDGIEKPGQEALRDMTAEEKASIELAKAWGGRPVASYDFEDREDRPAPIYTYDDKRGKVIQVGDTTRVPRLDNFKPEQRKVIEKELEQQRQEAQALFNKERAEHPNFSDEDIWQIVRDHLEKAVGPYAGRAKPTPYPMGALGNRPDEPIRDGTMLPGESPEEIEKRRKLGGELVGQPLEETREVTRRTPVKIIEHSGGQGAHHWERDETGRSIAMGKIPDKTHGMAPPRRTTDPVTDVENRIIPTPPIRAGPIRYPRDVPPVTSATGPSRRHLGALERDKPELIEKMAPPIPSAGGGKRREASFLRSLIPKHDLYVEPFAGGAALFFMLDPHEKAVLNDVEQAFPKVWKWIQEASSEDIEDLKTRKWSATRDQWLTIRDQYRPKSLTDEVWKILYLTRHSFRNTRRTWRGEISDPYRQKTQNRYPSWLDRIDEYRRQLNGTKVENRDWKEVMRDYDSPDTFFYIDPPYEEKFAKALPEILEETQGKWLLSFGDDGNLRKALDERGFNTFRVPTYNQINKPSGKTRTVRYELLASNYPIHVPKDLMFKAIGPEHAHADKVFYGSVRRERLLAKQLSQILQSYRTGKITRDKALVEGRKAIDANQARVLEIARRKASKVVGKRIIELSPEVSNRLEAIRTQALTDFQRIIDDSGPV